MKKNNSNNRNNYKKVLFKRRKKYILFFLIFTGLIYFTKKDFILVLKTENGKVSCSWDLFKYDSFNHPRLELLRKKENLDDVIEKGKNQFEKIVLLRRWTSKQWKAGSNFFYPPWDAVEIIELARKYNNRGFCAQYAIVFLQACLSMGIYARYVDLPGHFAVEVWSDDYNKWIYMDPMGDFHFEKNGEILSGWEICSSYWNNRWKSISKVDSYGKKTLLKSKEELSIFSAYSVLINNDHLTNPMTVKRDGVEEKLTLKSDFRQYPYVGRDRITFLSDSLAFKYSKAKEGFNDRPQTDDTDDFENPMNQAVLLFLKKIPEKGLIKFKLIAENSPDFEIFEGSFNENHRKKVPPGVQNIHLKPGINIFKAKILTKSGWTGKESYVKIFYKPGWF